MQFILTKNEARKKESRTLLAHISLGNLKHLESAVAAKDSSLRHKNERTRGTEEQSSVRLFGAHSQHAPAEKGDMGHDSCFVPPRSHYGMAREAAQVHVLALLGYRVYYVFFDQNHK